MARFFETQLVTPTSAYVSPPWELMKSKLDTMQTAQDQYRTSVDLLDKNVNALPNDTPQVLQKKAQVEGKLGDLRKLDYNDPQSRDQIYNTIKDVQSEFDNQHLLGLAQQKYDQFDDAYKQIQEVKKKDPTKGTYLQARLMHEELDNSKAIQQDPNGNFTNTIVNTPQDFVYKDPNAAFDDALKTAAYDAYSHDPQFLGTTQEGALELYKQGKGSVLTKQKIDTDLQAAFSNDPDLINSAKALTYNEAIKQGYSEADALTLSEQEGSFINTDSKGNKSWNDSTLLGNLANGRGTAAAFNREDNQYNFEHNAGVEEQKKHDINNPPPIITGQALQDLQFGTALSSTDKVNTTLANNEQGIRAEYAKLLTAQGKTLSPDTIAKMPISDIIYSIKQFPDQNLTPEIKGEIANYNLTQELDAEATQNAIKTSGIDPKVTLGVIVQKSSNPIVQKMTPEDIVAFYKSAQSMGTGGTWPAEAQNIASKYGIGPQQMNAAIENDKSGKYYNPNGKNVFTQLQDAQDKYNTAKNQYLSDNSAQRLKANVALSQNQVFKDETYVDPVDGQTKTRQVLDVTATTGINKQLDEGFAKGQFDMVPTSIPNPKYTPDGKNGQITYTLGQYKQMKLDAETDPVKRDELVREFSQMKPEYSQYSEVDANGNLVKPMYVSMGGESVKIDQSQVKVNYGTGLVGLNQLNGTERAQTQNYIDNISGHGVKDHTVKTADGLTVHIINTTNAGGAANNNDLQVYYTDANGNEVKTGPNYVRPTGEAALQEIMDLRKRKIITE